MASSHRKRLLGKAGSYKNQNALGSRISPESAGTSPHKPCCPECGSAKTWKDGIRETRLGPVQRWICRSCGYRFSDPKFNGLGTSKSLQTVYTKPLKSKPTIHSSRRVSSESQGRGASALLTGGHCLAKVETRKQERAAGATKPDKAINIGKLIDFAWHLKKEGASKDTIITYSSLLRKLVKLGANILDPESVKTVLAKHKFNPNTKSTIIAAYTSFANYCGLSWNPPKYKWQTKIPFIPQEKEIDALIAGCSKQIAAILQTLKETGMRIGEACRLKWTDIDIEKGIIAINEPEKDSNPRICKISTKLISMLQALPKKNEKVFGKSSKQNKTWIFKLQRQRLAKKLGNPRLLQITFHTLRHWKGTMEYHKTKDPWHVKKVLGHKNLRSTEIYINLDQAYFEEPNDDFISKAVKTAKEAQQLIEVGFEYVCTTPDGLMLFRKRK